MKRSAKNNECNPQAVHKTGTSSLEVIMAFTLLSSALAFSTPLIVRHKRLVQSQREYRLALDEASNQLDRLSIVPAEELSEAIPRLRPSEFVAARLPGVKLRGEVRPLDIGRRVQISISWGDEQHSAFLVTLAAWFLPEPAKASEAAERRAAP